MFKIAKQMRNERKDNVGSKYVRDENGTLKVKEETVMERWRSYFLLCLTRQMSTTQRRKIKRKGRY